MATYTAFCQQSDGGGTIWIDSVEAEDLSAAIEKARDECAAAWGYEAEHVHCLGVAAGNVEILHWDDIEDD